MSAILSRSVQRRAFRRSVRLPCQVVRERDFRLVSEFAIDLSTDGMQVATRARVLTGESLIVTFRSTRLGRWFDMEGTVARVLHGRREYDGTGGLGIAFQGMDEDTSHLLFEALRGLPPPPARRPYSA